MNATMPPLRPAVGFENLTYMLREKVSGSLKTAGLSPLLLINILIGNKMRAFLFS